MALVSLGGKIRVNDPANASADRYEYLTLENHVSTLQNGYFFVFVCRNIDGDIKFFILHALLPNQEIKS